MKDFWLEVRTMESAFTGAFSMFVSATNRPGVFSFRMVFTPLLQGEENGMGVVAIEFAYPNVERSSLASVLWRKAISLGRMYDQKLLDERPKRRIED